jgi:hypothetical protein
MYASLVCYTIQLFRAVLHPAVNTFDDTRTVTLVPVCTTTITVSTTHPHLARYCAKVDYEHTLPVQFAAPLTHSAATSPWQRTSSSRTYIPTTVAAAVPEQREDTAAAAVAAAVQRSFAASSNSRGSVSASSNVQQGPPHPVAMFAACFRTDVRAVAEFVAAGGDVDCDYRYGVQQLEVLFNDQSM